MCFYDVIPSRYRTKTVPKVCPNVKMPLALEQTYYWRDGEMKMKYWCKDEAKKPKIRSGMKKNGKVYRQLMPMIS